MVNICAEYGVSWDIKFNSAKIQRMSSGGYVPSTFTVTLYDKPVQWVHKLKYLGYFINHSCSVDYGNNMQNFYGSFNNIFFCSGS